MATNPKQELQELVDQLSDDDVATALNFLRHLAPLCRRDQGVPVLHRGRPISSIDELAGDVFPPEESAEEYDATIRRWRQEGTPSRG